MRNSIRNFVKNLIVMVLSLSLLLAYVPVWNTFADEAGTDIQSILSNMSTRQKITQCIMIDFRQWHDEDGKKYDMTTLNSEVAELLADYQFGSVILFGENIKTTDETVELTKAMQNAAMSKGGLPMIVAADQEGGRVFRLGSGTALPGNMAVGATMDSGNAEISGAIIGREIESVGINTTLAPVIDVNNNPANPVIGLRSFGDDPAFVGEYACRYLDGLNKSDIIGCAKHFPGHGDTSTDSHYGLPVVDKSLESLRECELVPFQTAIDHGIGMIMTAHILYPQVDDSTIFSEMTGKDESVPATMSEKILTEILRGEMGYNGVIVTDAMNMKGIANNFSMEQATTEALKAGADIVCMPVTGVIDKQIWIDRMESIISAVEKAVNENKEFAAKLDESVARILTLKKDKGILEYDPSYYTQERAEATVGSKENRSLERDIAAKAVTVISNNNKTLPLRVDEKTKVLMLAPYNNEQAQMVMGLNRAKEAKLIPDSVKVWVTRYSSDDISGEIEKDLEWADVVIINSEVSSASQMDYSSWLSNAPRLYTEYCKKHGKKSIVMSVDMPYDVQLYPDADAVITVFGCKGSNISGMPQLIHGETTADTNACGPNISAGVEVIFGVYGASGKLPVNIPVYDQESKSYTDSIAYSRGYGITYESEKVNLQKAVIKSLTAGRRKLTVKMSTTPAKKGGKYYKIAYKVKGTGTWKYKTTQASSVTIRNLKKGKKYAVKVCVYKKVNGSNRYGAWSNLKTSAKIK